MSFTSAFELQIVFQAIYMVLSVICLGDGILFHATWKKFGGWIFITLPGGLAVAALPMMLFPITMIVFNILYISIFALYWGTQRTKARAYIEFSATHRWIDIITGKVSM